MSKVMFTVDGEPTGKGRPRFSTRGKFVRAVTPQKTVSYENLVKMEYQAQCAGTFFNSDVALGMRITAFKPIPKSASKKKTLKMLEGLIRPGKKPDWDNIGKIVCDALNGIAFQDDSQIVSGTTIKKYSEQPRVEVEIWEEGVNG